eukprot:404671_1
MSFTSTKFEYCVAGYIRNECTIHALSIPFDIECICLQYYSKEEHVSINSHPYANHSDGPFPIIGNISMDSCIVTTRCVSAHCEGHDEFSRFIDFVGDGNILDFNDTSICKYIWIFKLLKLPETESIGLGIQSNRHAVFCHTFQLRIAKHKRYVHPDPSMFNVICNDKAEDGDTIKMVLDIETKTIGYSVNDGDIVCFNPRHWQPKTLRNQPHHFERWSYALFLNLPCGSVVQCIDFWVEQRQTHAYFAHIYKFVLFLFIVIMYSVYHNYCP